MEKFNRAVRRQQISRLKKKRQFYWGYGAPKYQTRINPLTREYEFAPVKGFQEPSIIQWARLVNNPAACSCMGCGNSRRYFGKSLKEISEAELIKVTIE